METKQVEKAITTMKGCIDHPLRRHLIEILNQSTTQNALIQMIRVKFYFWRSFGS